jgi:hypothetical protein
MEKLFKFRLSLSCETKKFNSFKEDDSSEDEEVNKMSTKNNSFTKYINK